MKRTKVVVIGGGTGTFVALSGLKKYPNLDLSVIVSMMDDGGSNRVIRDEFGYLPTSDIRQCLIALSSKDTDQTLRKLFNYRYNAGTGISGMTFGNLFMAALTDIYKGDQDKAIEETCKILHVQGKVIPVTFDKTHLVAKYENKKEILGEHNIDEPDQKQGQYRILNIDTLPKAALNPKATIAIQEADIIVLGPGDLYTSVLCNLVVGDLSQRIKKSKAKKVFVINLMTKFGQTNNFKASDFVHEVEKYLGQDVVDYYIINNSIEYPPNLLEKYGEEASIPVINNLDEIKNRKFKVLKENVVSNKVYEKQKSDILARSLIRHDSDKLAKVIASLT